MAKAEQSGAECGCLYAPGMKSPPSPRSSGHFFLKKSADWIHHGQALGARALKTVQLTPRPDGYAATNGKAGGKLPAGNLAVRSPARSFWAASRKVATNHPYIA